MTFATIERHARQIAVIASTVLFAGAPLLAQSASGSRVLITVYKKGSLINSILPGAAVCFTSTDYTKITDQRGIVVYDNVPQGNWSAIGWKSGFKVKRSDIAVPGTATDVRASIVLESGTDSSPCILPNASPPASYEVALTVQVVRADHTPIVHAKACVGNYSEQAIYGADYDIGTSGRAHFTVPKRYSVSVTAEASGFIGVSKTVYLNNTDGTEFVEITLEPGSGGKKCPVY
jgi:hypothetical protein